MKIYVGTYNKYNNGSIAGAWLDLSDYNDAHEFIDACYTLHNDEIGKKIPQSSEPIIEEFHELTIRENC